MEEGARIYIGLGVSSTIVSGCTEPQNTREIERPLLVCNALFLFLNIGTDRVAQRWWFKAEDGKCKCGEMQNAVHMKRWQRERCDLSP